MDSAASQGRLRTMAAECHRGAKPSPSRGCGSRQAGPAEEARAACGPGSAGAGLVGQATTGEARSASCTRRRAARSRRPAWWGPGRTAMVGEPTSRRTQARFACEPGGRIARWGRSPPPRARLRDGNQAFGRRPSRGPRRPLAVGGGGAAVATRTSGLGGMRKPDSRPAKRPFGVALARSGRPTSHPRGWRCSSTSGESAKASTARRPLGAAPVRAAGSGRRSPKQPPRRWRWRRAQARREGKGFSPRSLPLAGDVADIPNPFGIRNIDGSIAADALYGV